MVLASDRLILFVLLLRDRENAWLKPTIDSIPRQDTSGAIAPSQFRQLEGSFRVDLVKGETCPCKSKGARKVGGFFLLVSVEVTFAWAFWTLVLVLRLPQTHSDYQKRSRQSTTPDAGVRGEGCG